MPQRMFIDCDNDGHWYLVPAAKRGDWHAWVDLHPEDERSCFLPDFVTMIDGPHCLTFVDPISD